MAALEAGFSKLTLESTPGQEGKEKEKNDRYNTDDEDFDDETREILPFRFFDLPSEIRLKVYEYVLFGETKKKGPPRTNGNVGSSRKNKIPAPLSHRLSLFLSSRRIHDEASVLFYSVQTFRVFQIQDYSKQPTLISLAPSYRPLIKKIELILGSSWTAPPKSWKVTKHLGLTEMTGVRTLKIFIQCDPSHPVFEGFRVSSDFYTGFAGGLVQKILEQLPNLVQVEFDAWPSVQKSGPLMRRLLSEVRASNVNIHWGPERGWNDWEDEELNTPTSKSSAGPVAISGHKSSVPVSFRNHVSATGITTVSLHIDK